MFGLRFFLVEVALSPKLRLIFVAFEVLVNNMRSAYARLAAVFLK